MGTIAGVVCSLKREIGARAVSVSETFVLRAGIYKASASTDPMKVGAPRRSAAATRAGTSGKAR